jgi:hypothetical protein
MDEVSIAQNELGDRAIVQAAARVCPCLVLDRFWRMAETKNPHRRDILALSILRPTDMLIPVYPWSLNSLWRERPSLGGLMALCEENYRILARLVIDMREHQGYRRSPLHQGMDLHLEILEQTPYTTLLHLTYYFPHEGSALPDPDASLRAYHDACQVEVLDLRQTALPLARGPHFPDLEQKWKANLFLSKWLSYCLSQGHQFLPDSVVRNRSCAASC